MHRCSKCPSSSGSKRLDACSTLFLMTSGVSWGNIGVRESITFSSIVDGKLSVSFSAVVDRRNKN